MMRRAVPGFTLIETIVACSLLLVVFNLGLSQSQTLSDFQVFARLIKRDLELAHYYSVATVPRTADTSRGTVDREGLSLAGLSDWRDDARFEATTGLPKWDRWKLFHANREDVGTLFRS